MKYLKIYEAFQSEVISSVIKHVKKKIGNNNINGFISSLKAIKDIYKIPIDKIQSEDIKYLSTRKGLEIKPDENTVYNNHQRVDKIKFWFSIEKGYVTTTGIGDYRKSNRAGLSEEEINYVKNDLNLKTGSLYQINDYTKLRTGDYILLFLGTRRLSNLTLARVFIEDGSIYAIQNSKRGSEPYGGNWQQFGPNSWAIGTTSGNRNSDHKLLHLYKNNDLPLGEESKENDELFIKTDGTLNTTSMIDLNDTDFVIVLDINNIFKKGFENISNIKDRRRDYREGATKLMSDDKIKSLNLERYLMGIIKKMGIGEKTYYKDINNLQKIVKLVTCDDYTFYAIYNNSPSMENIIEMSKSLYTLIENKDNYYYTKVVDSYKNLKRLNNDYKSKYIESMQIMDSADVKELKELFIIINRISNLIASKIKSSNIKTINDLNIMYHKIRYVRTLFTDFSLKFSQPVKNLLNSLIYPEDAKYYINDMDWNEDLIKGIKKDIRKAKIIEKNIKDMFN